MTHDDMGLSSPEPFITIASLCTGGVAGLDVVGRWLGWRTVLYCEIDPYRQAFIQARIRDGLLDDAPIWDDLRTLDWGPWRGKLAGLVAGFPCTPHSVAGKRLGAADERDLWPEVRRAIGESRPGFCFLENSAGLALRNGEQEAFAWNVIADLAALGYVGSAGIVAASDAGAPHQRQRIFFAAYDESALADADEVGSAEQEGERQTMGRTEYRDRARRAWEELAEADASRSRKRTRLPAIGREPLPDPDGSRGSGENVVDPEGDGRKSEGQGRELRGAETKSRPRLPGGSGQLVEHPNNPRHTLARRGEDGTVTGDTFPWPARYGEPQHPWEPPRTVESGLGRYPNGLPAWLVERIRKARVSANGDGVVPAQALLAWELLTGGKG